jgi:hypothetical protein
LDFEYKKPKNAFVKVENDAKMDEYMNEYAHILALNPIDWAAVEAIEKTIKL